jgi:L-amino acid N-acyltransferase YncA
MRIRAACPEDARAIADIYNAGIMEGGATFDTSPQPVEEIERRLTAAGRYPMIVAEDNNGAIRGWAGVGPYRTRACYAGIGEFSVYVAPDARGQGIGRRLLDSLADAARECGFWKLVSRVFPFNAASLKACRAAGFREAGRYEKHGFLDGRWQDVVIVERLIPENQTPTGLRFRRATRGDWPAITVLLGAASLPLAGAEEQLDHFVLAIRRDDIVGCATYESGTAAAGAESGRAVLLRSVALAPAERGAGAGRLIVERALERARQVGGTSAILLTTTAEAFFGHLGFERITRADVPASLLESAEFTGACPASAVIMRRRL